MRFFIAKLHPVYAILKTIIKRMFGMNKKLINSIIMLLASGVCFFFAVTGITVGVSYMDQSSKISSSLDKLKSTAKSASSDYMKEYYEKQIKSLEEKISEQTGPLIRNAFTDFILAAVGILGVVFGVRYFIGKNHYSIFSWIAAGVTTAAAIAYFVGAIVAVADKEAVYGFNLHNVQDSPLGVFYIIFGVIFILILAAQFLTIILAKNGEDSPISFGAPAPAPAAPAAPVAPIAQQPVAPAPAPAAPVAPAPAEPVAQPTETPGAPVLG